MSTASETVTLDKIDFIALNSALKSVIDRLHDHDPIIDMALVPTREFYQRTLAKIVQIKDQPVIGEIAL